MLENNDTVSVDYKSNLSDDEQSDSEHPKSSHSAVDDSELQINEKTTHELKVECQVCNQQVHLQRRET